ncbi:hypothetical protein AAH102_08165 [Bacteroides fragilis]
MAEKTSCYVQVNIKIRQGTDWENTFQDSGPHAIGEPCRPGAKLRP